MKTKQLKVLVEQFQCPGCVCGSSTNCGHFVEGNFHGGGGFCGGHILGTMISTYLIAMGLPMGFNRFNHDKPSKIIFWNEDPPRYVNTCFPVWAYEGQGESKGFLFLRVVEPRIDRMSIHVVKGCTLKKLEKLLDPFLPRPLNVSKFLDEID